MTIRIGPVAELLDVFGRIQRSHTLVGACLVGELGILSRIDILGAVGSPLPAKGGCIVDLRLAFLAALRCDDDDAVGSFGAIDGSRSSILQYGDRLDVVGSRLYIVLSMPSTMIIGEALLNVPVPRIRMALSPSSTPGRPVLFLI